MDINQTTINLNSVIQQRPQQNTGIFNSVSVSTSNSKINWSADYPLCSVTQHRHATQDRIIWKSKDYNSMTKFELMEQFIMNETDSLPMLIGCT